MSTTIKSLSYSISTVCAIAALLSCAAIRDSEAQVRYRDEVFTSVSRTNAIVFGEAVNVRGEAQTLELDFYEPAGDTAAARPLVIFVHGGGFNSGTRNAEYIVSVGEYLARNGYSFASISYRLDTLVYSLQEINVDSVDFSAPAFPLRPMANAMHDARAAVRFFRKNATHYRIDPAQIYMGGDSAGGITALLVGFHDKLSEIPADAVPFNVEGTSGSTGLSSAVTGVWFGCARSYLLDAIEVSSETKLIAGFYNQGDPLIFPRHSAAVMQQSRDVGMTPRGIAFESGIHCSWLVPILGFVDLINYATTLKDALYSSLTATTGTEPVAALTNFLSVDVFPNPFSDNLSVSLSFDGTKHSIGPTAHGNLIFFDLQGRQVWSAQFFGSSTTVHPNLAAGVYVIEVSTSDERRVRRLVVAR